MSTPTPMMLVQSGVSTQQAPVLPGGLYSQHVPVAAGIMPQQVAGQGAGEGVGWGTMGYISDTVNVTAPPPPKKKPREIKMTL